MSDPFGKTTGEQVRQVLASMGYKPLSPLDDTDDHVPLTPAMVAADRAKREAEAALLAEQAAKDREASGSVVELVERALLDTHDPVCVGCRESTTQDDTVKQRGCGHVLCLLCMPDCPACGAAKQTTPAEAA